MGIYSFTFSPTGTSAKVLRGINAGISETSGSAVDFNDLTCEAVARKTFDADDVVVVSSPVYGGKVAPVAKSRLDGLPGNGARCVVVAVYGNRAFENAVCDFAAFMSEHGFVVCGGAAFVGEHSYSTAAMPIAQGRPDSRDIDDAKAFGREIGVRICGGSFRAIDCGALSDEPSPAGAMENFKSFVADYQRQQAEAPRVYLPQLDESLCNGCGICYAVCPTGAITEGMDGVDPSRCIKCCACVKSCAQGARVLESPFARPLWENFGARKSPVWLL